MTVTPNAVRCAMRYTVQGLEAFNILHVVYPAPATPANLVALAAVFQSWWNATKRPTVASSVQWNGVTLTALDGPGAPYLDYPATPLTSGTNTGAPWPPQITVAVSLRTGLSGRSYRGRIYLVGFNNTNVLTAGVMLPATVAGIQTVYNALRSAIITHGAQLCVVSLFSGVDGSGNKIPRAVGIATPVSTIIVGNRIDTQRRRLPVEARA